MKKIPVPIVPPIPIAERPHSPTVRLSSLRPVSAPVSSSISSTGLRRKACSRIDAIVPPSPRAGLPRLRYTRAPPLDPNPARGTADDGDLRRLLISPSPGQDLGRMLGPISRALIKPQTVFGGLTSV